MGQPNSNEKLKKENTARLNETLTVPKLRLQSVFISGVFIVNFEHTNFTPCTSVSIFNLDQVNAGWEVHDSRPALHSTANKFEHASAKKAPSLRFKQLRFSKQNKNLFVIKLTERHGAYFAFHIQI